MLITFALLAFGLNTITAEAAVYPSLFIFCASDTALCNGAKLPGGIFATMEEAIAEADRVAVEGCWWDSTKFRCTSVRSPLAWEKLSPGGIRSIAIVLSGP